MLDPRISALEEDLDEVESSEEEDEEEEKVELRGRRSGSTFGRWAVQRLMLCSSPTAGETADPRTSQAQLP